jgi:hypothetical protein
MLIYDQGMKQYVQRMFWRAGEVRSMLESERKILETFKRHVPNLPEEKQEYLLGVSEEMVALHTRDKNKTTEKEKKKE